MVHRDGHAGETKSWGSDAVFFLRISLNPQKEIKNIFCRYLPPKRNKKLRGPKFRNYRFYCNLPKKAKKNRPPLRGGRFYFILGVNTYKIKYMSDFFSNLNPQKEIRFLFYFGGIYPQKKTMMWGISKGWVRIEGWVRDRWGLGEGKWGLSVGKWGLGEG